MTERHPGPIGFFLPSLCAGGAERVVVNLAEGMSTRGLRVDLVVATAEGELLERFPPTVRLVDLRAKRVIRALLPLASYLQRERPRVLISSIGHANIVALWAARLARCRTPVMVTVHSTMSRSTPGRGGPAARVWPTLLHTFYPWATWIVAVSRGAADDLARTARLPRDRIHVLYNPVITPGLLTVARQPPRHAWFAPGEPPVVLGVGRLTAAKDFPNLMRAFAKVRERRPARLLILGEGEERSRLETLADELGLGDTFALPGFRPDAMACMAKAAVFVLSSAWEGLPTVLIEALAAGTQAVATDCLSGPREILQDGRLGTLVPVGDSTALADAIIQALECPRVPVSPTALAPFTQEAAIDRYLALIEKIP